MISYDLQAISASGICKAFLSSVRSTSWPPATSPDSRKARKQRLVTQHTVFYDMMGVCGSSTKVVATTIDELKRSLSPISSSL